ncbi:Acetyltransferase (GNAT) family protein [Alkalispirochaeta americana]|uniref:Acetyltransferase (GNAT) family protein n=1 Tax=Alkalispirochaeta americana TaxID=159291 RepID=A0A1N6SGY9_9SPIO|nr:GNAT family N-acetyltransferase [Alkalispirochaeta americana]SIQ40413.1 Acetyltransferase (GNAT) family protein [Alkalispirochaeta americana]
MSDRAPIRPMEPGEKPAVKRLARRAFGPLQGSLVTLTRHTFLCEISGELAGAVVLETFRYKRNQLGGVIKWLFTDPEAQGQGVAAALVREGVARLQELGCHELFTTVEGFNTPSSNRFADLGFAPLSPWQQLRRYGLSLLRIGPPTFHTIDTGHFLWSRSAAEPPREQERTVPGGGALPWVANVIFVAALVALHRLRVGAAGELHLHLLWQLPLALSLVFGVRSGAMKLTARALGLSLRYRIWETGLVLSLIITVLFGGLFPTPGSHYPVETRWNYRSKLPRLAAVAFSGAFAVLALAWFLLACETWGLAQSPRALASILALAVAPVQALLVFEVLLPWFPFASFNGRRVLDHHRLLWAGLAIGTAALFWVRYAG